MKGRSLFQRALSLALVAAALGAILSSCSGGRRPAPDPPATAGKRAPAQATLETSGRTTLNHAALNQAMSGTLRLVPGETLSQAIDRCFPRRSWRIWGASGALREIQALNPQLDLGRVTPDTRIDLGKYGKTPCESAQAEGPPSLRFPAAVAETAQKQELPEKGPLNRGPNLSFFFEPQYFSLRQTLQSTLSEFQASGFVSNDFDLRYQTDLSRSLLVNFDLGYSSLSNAASAVPGFSVMQSSNVSYFTPMLTFEQRNRFDDGSEIRPIFGLALQHDYVFEFQQNNSSLALDSIEDVMLELGVHYRFRLIEGSDKSMMTLGLEWEKGLGELNDSETRWQSSDTFTGKILWERSLGNRWALDLGMNAASRKDNFMILGDSWTQSYFSFSGVLGLTFNFSEEEVKP